MRWSGVVRGARPRLFGLSCPPPSVSNRKKSKMRICTFLCILVLAGGFVAATPSPAKCGLCKIVAKEIWGFAKGLASNSTKVDHIIHQLDDECDSKFSQKPLEKKACELIVKGLVKLVPFAFKEINTLAWDSANLCAIAGMCTVNCCDTKAAPEQVHLSLMKDLSEMAVMWTTLENTKTHAVEYGVSPSSLNLTMANGMSSSYDHFGWKGIFHSVKLTKLKPGTRYFYRVGDEEGGWSKTFSFRTFHEDIGTTAHPLRVASVGDMGYAANSDMTIKRLSDLIDRENIDMVVHNGDISYADGEFSHWDVFMRKIEPVASRVPYQVTPGNHEMWFNFSAYKHRFYMADEGEHDNLYYGFHVGGQTSRSGVHFVGMDTETWYDRAHISKEQASWIAKELGENQRARWRIVYGHRPLYCSNHHGQDIPHGNGVLRKAIEDVLYQNKVDLVLQAHEHDYERSFPVYGSKTERTNYTNPRAPVYIVNGAAGNREANERAPGGEAYWPPSLNRTNLISYGLMTITERSIVWDQIVSSDNSRQDTFTLTKTD
jgi:acid phosphatase type 7